MEPIMLVKSRSGLQDERYATLSGMDGLVLLVQWKTEELHEFLRSSGTCVSSPGGVMRGWSVSPEDLAKFSLSEEARAAAPPTPPTPPTVPPVKLKTGRKQ